MHLLQRSEFGQFLNDAGLFDTGAEVGVAEGLFSREILAAWRGKALVLIDCWAPQAVNEYRDIANHDQNGHVRRRASVATLCQSDPRAHMLVGFTPMVADKFADGSLDFVYLDANHSFLAVRADLEAWYPKLKVGGFLAGHDYLDGYIGFDRNLQGGTLFGVKTAVDDFARGLGQAVGFTLGDGPFRTWFLRKRNLPQEPRISVVTGYESSFATIGNVSRQNKLHYCQRHGYRFCCHTDGFDTARPPAWSKIRFVLGQLNECDWVFWTDADSLVMNAAIPLTRFVDEAYDLILPVDRVAGINTGCFFVKNSLWARSFLEQVYRQEQFLNHPWWENAAIIHLYRQDPDVQRHVLLLPNKLFNAFLIDGSYEAGDLLIHFPGMKDREVFMKNYAAMAR